MNSKVKVGDWIYVGESRIQAYVFRVISDVEVYAGYYQNQIKAIGENFILKDNSWLFKYDGLNGTYLRGAEESIIKRGP